MVTSICQGVDSEGTNEAPTPYNEVDHIVELFGIDTYAMDSLSLENASGRDISRTLGMIESQEWSFSGDQQRSARG